MTITLRRFNAGDRVRVQDWFCGAGGSSQGAELAGAEVVVAANHDPNAIETHAANFPHTEHALVDLLAIDPADMPKCEILIASPECINHSLANSKKLYELGDALAMLDPEWDNEEYLRQERSRSTMLAPLRYADFHRPYIVVLENVIEAAWWGVKHPNKNRGDGSTFRWYLDQWRALGYSVTPCFMNSQFAPPTPQSRDRMYLVMVLDGIPMPDLEHRPRGFCDYCGFETETYQKFKQAAGWPLPRWGRWGERNQYVYACPHCNSTVMPYNTPVAPFIDWSDLGEVIGDRKRPLSAATIERIRRGLARWHDYPPFTLTASGHTFEREGYARVRHIMEPTFTQSTSQTLGLAIPPALWCKSNGGLDDTANYAYPCDRPVGTITAKDHTALIGLPQIDHYYGNGYTTPVDESVGTMTTKERHGLIVPPKDMPDVYDCRYRLLKDEPELKGIMGFRPDYKLMATSKTVRVKLLGNAVTPPVMAWYLERCIASLRGDTTPRF